MPVAKNISVNITGPSYQSRSRPLLSQQTKNFYMETVDSGKSQYVLQPFPGLKEFANIGGLDRGSTEVAGLLYQVMGGNLYSVVSNGTVTTIGAIPGTEYCTFANDGVSLFIVADSVVTQYNSSTSTLSTVTDVNIVGAQSVDYIKSNFLYTFPTRTQVSDVGNGAAASGLNSVGAESSPDNLVRDYVFKQVIYRMGTRTTETWWYTGQGQPPIEVIEPQMFEVGLAAKHSIANTDEFMYWLGDDRQVYIASGGSLSRVSNVAIANAIENYSTVSDAIGQTVTFQGKNFYVLKFPTEDKTWVINEELGPNGWFEISSGLNDGRWVGQSITRLYGKNLVSHESDGKIYELDLETFTEGTETVQRRRVMSSIDGRVLNSPGSRLQMSRFELIMEKGIGLLTGQGEDPRIMIESSKDGGKSWSAGTWMRIGRLGETQLRAEWYSMMTFYDLIIRITITDPVFVSIYRAAIDLRVAGR